MTTHEPSATMIHDRAELAAWIAANAPHLRVDEIEAGIARQAAGVLPVYPLQARYAADNGLVRDANGRGNISRNASAYPTYGNPEFGRIDRMSLETRS